MNGELESGRKRGGGGKKEQASNAGIIAKHHHTPGQGKEGIVDES